MCLWGGGDFIPIPYGSKCTRWDLYSWLNQISNFFLSFKVLGGLFN